MVFEFMSGIAGAAGIVGTLALTILGVIFIVAIGFGGYKLMRYYKDYPYKATLWTVRSNGLYPIQDALGIFLDKKEGKKYAKLRHLKLTLPAVLFQKIDDDAKAMGRVNLLRKSNEEIIALSTKELLELIEQGKLNPVINSEVRFYQSQGVRRDYELLIKGDWLEKWAFPAVLFACCVVLFIAMIVFSSVAEKTIQATAQANEMSKNDLAGQLAAEKSSEINLLLYTLAHNITIEESVNYTALFKNLNISQVIPASRIIR